MFCLSTGKDNADGPILPKTPSTCRRLRTRQQRKRKPECDGSPQLPRTLRSKASRQKYCEATVSETTRPLDNISNKLENTEQVGTVKRSGRQAAMKASQAISQLNEKRKGSSISKKSGHNQLEVTDEINANTPFNKVAQTQESASSRGHTDTTPTDKDVTETSSDESMELQPVHTNTQQQKVKDISSSVIMISDDESTPKESTLLDQASAHHDQKSIPHTSPQFFFTPVVINCAQSISSSTTQMTSESTCMNEANTPPASHEDICTATDDDTYSTPPSNVSTNAAVEEPKPADSIRRNTTILKKSPDPNSYDKVNQVTVYNGSCIDLALLTKLTPPAKPTEAALTPATVIKDSFTVKTSTVIKDCPTSSAVTPATITKTPATITKVVAKPSNAEEQNDGSPEFTVIKKPLGCQVGSACTVTGATQKQITPNNAFSPAKLKVNIAVFVYHIYSKC